MKNYLMRLFGANGNALPDEVLVEPRQDGLMHPAVAVANMLRSWALSAPEQCRQAFPDVVRLGTLRQHDAESTVSDIDGQEFKVISNYSRNGAIKPERCLSGTRAGQPNEENYWILNPGVSGNRRLVVRIRRKYLAELVEQLNDLARRPENAAIFGMCIRLAE